jgi:fructose-specific phosphotransferase system IIC component
MLATVQLWIEAAVAVALAAMIGIISGFIAVAITEDRELSIGIGFGGLILTGTVLAVRLWWMMRRPALPPVAPSV